MKKNWKLEAGLWQERFENAAQWNARFEGKLEKFGDLLHLCREGFLDIEKHSDDPFKKEFWLNYCHEIAYNMNKIISQHQEKYGLEIHPRKGERENLIRDRIEEDGILGEQNNEQ